LFLPIAATTLALLALAIMVPGLRQIFQLGVPSLGQLAVVVAVGMLSWVVLELLKLVPSVRRITGAVQGA
jgi:hypothetical protein